MSSSKPILNIALLLPEGETVRDVQDRIQKFFTYYHPRYEAVVTIDPSNPAEPGPIMVTPAEDFEMTPEMCELLGIDSSALDLLK